MSQTIVNRWRQWLIDNTMGLNLSPSQIDTLAIRLNGALMREPPDDPEPSATPAKPQRFANLAARARPYGYTHCPEHGIKLVRGKCSACESPFTEDE